MQCYIYLSYISYFINKCEIGDLDIIEHSQLYLVKHYINIKKTFAPFNLPSLSINSMNKYEFGRRLKAYKAKVETSPFLVRPRKRL